ncbi:MAG: hypothetical protein RLZZ139_1807 [Cyanobacteriota bacterium]|jgi:hypothetical protein
MINFFCGATLLILSIGVSTGRVSAEHVPILTGTVMAALGAREAVKPTKKDGD